MSIFDPVPMVIAAFLPLVSNLNILNAADSAPAVPSLSVPASPVVLNVKRTLPAGARLEAGKSWQLVEKDGRAAPVLVELVPAAELDGTLSQAAHAVAVSIPPRSNARDLREFKLVEAGSGVPEATNAFRFADVNDKSLGLWEGDRPVFVYNHGVLSKPGVPADRNRSTYLHPIYGLDGEVLTDDFPKDHFHHRGLFWAWPHVRVGGSHYSSWDIRGIHQRFERWVARHAGPHAACLGVENGWFVGERKVVQERVWFTVYPASADSQIVDIDLVCIPIDEPLSLAGAEEKSYGGLTLRFAPRTETLITTPLGNQSDDLAMTRLPWADLSARFAGAPEASGAAIFISPDHPDFPPTWLTRHYGVLCVGWPGIQAATFQPGQIVRARYRLWIHRQSAIAAGAKLAYESYEAAHEVRWSTSGE